MKAATMKERLLALLPALRRFAWSLTNSVHDADDLLQNTVERLLVKGMPDGADLNKWAFTVCRNLWIDECRSRKVRGTVAWDQDEHDVVTVDGEKDMQLKIEVAQINALLQQLPEEQHLVLSMVTVQGLSYQETADALGVPLGTVMSRLARARTRLVELVGNDRSYGAFAPTLH
ncbi:MAG: RNA polymerase sigma factor [Pseudomonadota bacterium]|nr:RNA polymerase sigma factor [Pseudomonadota bacterium]